MGNKVALADHDEVTFAVIESHFSFFHATIGLRMFIVTILFCPFDTKVCVRVMSWMLRKWWLLILVVGYG